MHIFLQGPSGIGKSSLLREVLAQYALLTAGFVVQRLTENQATVAFRAACIENDYPQSEAKYHPELGGVFVSPGLKWDTATLDEAILCVCGKALEPSCKLILLDEIGGVELNSKAFMSSLEQLLSGAKPCFGVFKSRENFARTAFNLKLPADYIDFHKRLEARILASGEIITLTDQNHPETLEYLKKAVASAVFY